MSAKQSSGQLSEGEHYLEGFDNVVDASGTYGNPNWMGKGGTPALGERALRERRKSRLLQVENHSIISFFEILSPLWENFNFQLYLPRKN